MKLEHMMISSLIVILTVSSVCPMANAQSGKPAPTSVVETRGADWTLSVEPDATVTIRHKGAPVIQTYYQFWGANFVWAGGGRAFQVKSKTNDGLAMTGKVAGLKIDASGTIRSLSLNTVGFDFLFQASQGLSDVIGGGLTWKLNLGSPTFGGRLPDPELLDGGTGWKWPVGHGQFITVRADQRLAKVYFERNQKNEIRTFFYAEQVPAGPRRVRLTLTLPEGGRRTPSIEERYGTPDTKDWFRGAMAWDASPVDLRFLNRDDRPAGRRGFVKADGDRLVFADGAPARFWATVLAANALFSTPRQNIAPQARRMAQLGYNLVRFTHHDSHWVKPNVFDPSHDDTRHLDAKSLDTLDWWIKSLKDEGIYVWLDLRAARRLKPGDGVTFGRDEIMRRDKGAIEAFHYYNPELHKLMVEFQHAYLNHVNRYTGLAYKDDPAIVCVPVTNEDDLTQHGGNLVLPVNNPVHGAVFTRRYQAFARAHGLPPGRVFQTWLPGPSKLYLNEEEHQFNETMIADLRALGVKAPIATTNHWVGMAGYSLPALADGDVIDVHSYGVREALSDNPRYVANYLSHIAAAQVYGKPLTISEWNVLYDGPRQYLVSSQVDRFTGPLYMASIAALQGWDAPMLYTYSQDVLRPPQKQAPWSSFFDPALSGMIPAAALAYRQGHISPARKTYRLDLGPDQLFNRLVNADTSATIRTLSERSKLTIGMPAVKELPWLKPSQPPARDVIVVSDPDHDYLPPGQSFVQSDTGELTRDWESGTQTIDTPRTQAVSGWIGGKAFETHDAVFRFETKKAVVALTSVDNLPLATSRFILISAMARAIASPGNRPPMLSEPVIGTVVLRAAAEGLQLLALGPDGHVVGRSKPPRKGTSLTISLPAGHGTHWFVLKARAPSKGTGPATDKGGG